MDGNQMKMREALEEILLICYKAGARYGYDVACGLIKAKAKNALSVPNRNCNVGTAEEQYERYLAHCRRTPHCTGCETFTNYLEKCEFRWSQLPYEAQEGGEK